MIALCTCPHCKEEFVVSVCIKCLEEHRFESKEEANRYILENVIIRSLKDNGLNVSRPLEGEVED